MKSYRYATLMRPPQLGACPMDGMISCSCEEGYAPSGHHYWGWVKYNRPLSAKEIYDYELEELPDENPSMIASKVIGT